MNLLKPSTWQSTVKSRLGPVLVARTVVRPGPIEAGQRVSGCIFVKVPASSAKNNASLFQYGAIVLSIRLNVVFNEKRFRSVRAEMQGVGRVSGWVLKKPEKYFGGLGSNKVAWNTADESWYYAVHTVPVIDLEKRVLWSSQERHGAIAHSATAMTRRPRRHPVLRPNPRLPHPPRVHQMLRFPFSIPIDYTAPSSYKGKHLEIEYKVKGVISRAFPNLDRTSEENVEVAGLSPTEPLQSQEATNVKLCPSVGRLDGNVGTKLECARATLLTHSNRDAQRLEAVVTFENNSNRKITNVKLELVRREFGIAIIDGRRNLLDSAVVLASETRELDIAPNETEKSVRVAIDDIPSHLAPSLQTTGVQSVGIEYEIKCSAEVEWAALPLVVTIPVTVINAPPESRSLPGPQGRGRVRLLRRRPPFAAGDSDPPSSKDDNGDRLGFYAAQYVNGILNMLPPFVGGKWLWPGKK
ncbi:hypothetical protein BC828DRAFT_375443 [Blastocladiella britannica]|nr:hypothetical protein BC828DRAFT_375443 [Blastocladiella britannica]